MSKTGRLTLNTKDNIIKITKSLNGFGKSWRHLISLNWLTFSNFVLDHREPRSMASSTLLLIKKIGKQQRELLKVPYRIFELQQIEPLP